MEDWRWINKWQMKQIPWLFRKKLTWYHIRLSLRFTQLVGKRDLFFFYTPGNVTDISSCSLILQRNSVAEPEDKRRRIPQLVFLEGVGYTLFPMLLKKVEEKRKGHRKIKVSERMWWCIILCESECVKSEKHAVRIGIVTNSILCCFYTRWVFFFFCWK